MLNSLSTPKIFLLILAAAALAYLPFVNGQLFWDDEQFIYNNQYVRQFALKEIFTNSTTAGAGEPSNYYRPLTTLSFAIDHQIWGLNPVGFNLTNLFLHAGAGMFLFVVLKQLKLDKKSSLVISLLFILHPIQTETVAYANSRGDSMFVLWGLFGLFALLKIIELEQQQQSSMQVKIKQVSIEVNKNSLALAASSLYAISILSKEIGLAVMGIYWLGAIYLWATHRQKYRTRIRDWFDQHKVSMGVLFSCIVIAAVYLLLRSGPLKFQEQLNPYPPGHPYGDSLVVRLSTFAKVLFIYLRLLVAPFQLHMERTTELVLSPWSGWVGGALLLGFTVGLVGLAEYRRHHRAPIWLGSAWFLAMLVPVSGIIPINDILYEHWLYLPSVGFWLVGYGLLKLIQDSSTINSKLKKILNTWLKRAVAIMLVIYLALTWRQNYLWADPVRFYNYTLQFNQTARMHNNLAMTYANREQHEQALKHYQAALKLDSGYAQIHNNLANTYLALGELNKAAQFFQQALERNPTLLQSHLGLINLYMVKEETELAFNQVEMLRELGLPEHQARQLEIEIEKSLQSQTR